MSSIQGSDLDRVMDKLARLRSLSERPGTPEEAASAVAAIQRLLLKHNLSAEHVEMARRNDRSGFDKHHVQLGGYQSGDKVWREGLITVLCRFNFCRAIMIKGPRGTRPQAFVVGEKVNVETVLGMYGYLTEAILRLSDESWSRIKGGDDLWERVYVAETSPLQYKDGFRNGAVEGIYQRLKEQSEKDRMEAESSALVILDDAVEKAVKELLPDTRQTKNAAKMMDTTARNHGVEAGKKINLAKQIQGSDDSPREIRG